MKFTINTQDIENTIRMFRNISLLKIDTKKNDEGQHSLELIFYKSDSSEFQVYGASGTMLRDAITEAIDSQYNYFNVNELDDNLFRISFKSIKGYTFLLDRMDMREFNINSREDIAEFFSYLIKDLNLNFHPDNPFYDYCTPEGSICFTLEESNYLESILELCFVWCYRNDADIYGIGLEPH